LDILYQGMNISIQGLGSRTGMTDDDVVSGLEGLNALVRDTQTGIYAIKVNREKLEERVAMVEKKGYVKVKQELLKWTPYLLGRREAKDLLEGGLEELIRQRTRSSLGTLDQNVLEAEMEEVQGKDIPPERFLSVTVRDLIQPPRIVYETTDPQTPIPTDIPATPIANGSTSALEADEDVIFDEPDEPAISSPSSPSIVEEDVSDELYSAEDFEEEEEVSDYISDDSNDFNPRKRRRLDRSSQPPRDTPEVVVRVKQVAKESRSRASFVVDPTSEVRPKVIAAKAPRSRAGHNPPEVMSRRTSARRG
jgi:hypothetical protein